MKFELKDSSNILAFINPNVAKDAKEDMSDAEYNKVCEELVAKLATSKFHSYKKDGKWILCFVEA